MHLLLPSCTARLGTALLLVGGLLFARPAAAQWVSQTSGLPAGSGPNNLSVVDATTVWDTVRDYNSANPSGSNPNNTFIRTTNGGVTWVPGTIADAAGYTLFSVGAASATVAWVVGQNLSAGGGRVYYTADGGATWTRQLTTGFTGNGFVDGVLAFSATQAVVAGDPNPSSNFEIYYTTNAGTTWTAATTPARIDANEGGLTNIVITVPGATASARSCWMATGSGRVLRSTDSGVTWAAAATGLSQVSALAFCSTTNGIAINRSVPGTIAYTTDGGATWALRTATGPVSLSSVAGVPGTRNTFVSGGRRTTDGQGSSYSVDGELTWTAIDALPHFALAFLNGTTGYSGGLADSPTSGGIYQGTLPAVALATAAARPLAGLNVHPNPAADNFTVTVPAVAGAAQVKATLYNALGQPVARQAAAAGATLSFPAHGLAAGLYTLRVQAGEATASQHVSVR